MPRKFKDLDKDDDYHFDIAEEWDSDIIQCAKCHGYFEERDIVQHAVLCEDLCFECAADWDATHCMQCGCEMPVDAAGIKLSDICDECYEEVLA